MARRGPFIPTHRLKFDYPGFTMLYQGMEVRQINPFAGARDADHCHCLDADDWARGGHEPWVFSPAELDPLPCWPEERAKMTEAIMNPTKGQK